MSADMGIVKVLNAKIADDLKNIGQKQKGKIKPIIAFRCAVLNLQVDAKNKKWLYQYVDKNQKQDIYNEFAVQNAA